MQAGRDERGMNAEEDAEEIIKRKVKLGVYKVKLCVDDLLSVIGLYIINRVFSGLLTSFYFPSVCLYKFSLYI